MWCQERAERQSSTALLSHLLCCTPLQYQCRPALLATHAPLRCNLPFHRSNRNCREGHAHLIRPLLDAGSAGIQEPRAQLSQEARQQMGVPDLLPQDQCMGQTLLALAAAKDAVPCLEVSKPVWVSQLGVVPALHFWAAPGRAHA